MQSDRLHRSLSEKETLSSVTLHLTTPRPSRTRLCLEEVGKSVETQQPPHNSGMEDSNRGCGGEVKTPTPGSLPSVSPPSTERQTCSQGPFASPPTSVFLLPSAKCPEPTEKALGSHSNSISYRARGHTAPSPCLTHPLPFCPNQIILEKQNKCNLKQASWNV